MNTALSNADNKRQELYVIAEVFYPVSTGLEINMLNTYSNMAARGWDITVHTTKSNVLKRNILPQFSSIAGLKIFRHNFYGFSFIPFFVRPPFRKPVTIVLHDFLVFPHIYFYSYVYLLKMFGLKRCRLIFSSHGLFNYDSKIYPGFRMKLKKFLDQKIGVFLINNIVDAIRAVSETEAKGLASQGIRTELITVVVNGLEEIAFEDCEIHVDDEMKRRVGTLGDYIIQIGRIDKVKNQAAAIHALSLVSDKRLKLVLLGPVYPGGYKKGLENLIENLKMSDRVIFWGIEYSYNKYYLVKNAKAVIHMAYSEGFCNAVHEAMSQGCICVVSKNTALEELIKDGVNGFCESANDYKAIAGRIKWILDEQNKKSVGEIKNNNIHFVKGHTWKNISYQVENLYKRT